jgi:hypothetical protein
MNSLFTAVLLIAIVYAVVQFGWVICVLLLMGVAYVATIIRSIALTLLLMVQKQRIIQLIKLKAKQARRST